MVVRTTRASIGSEKRKASVAIADCRTDSAGSGRPGRLEARPPVCAHARARTKALHGGGLVLVRSLGYMSNVQAVTLSYKVKLYPTQNKADTLALLTALFARFHTACTSVLREESRCPSAKGMGEFAGRAYRRAFTDWRRTRKAGHIPGTLKAELIDAAHVQTPRHATGFDLWIMVQGVGKLY